MRFKIYITITALSVVALAVEAWMHAPMTWVAATGVVTIASLALLYRSVVKPLNAVQNGIFLIKDQDFASRLRLTGEHDADRVVELFNRLMDAMKAERLKTMEQNRFLSLLIEASPMGIAMCDYDGNVIETNKAWNQLVTPVVKNEIDKLDLDTTVTVRIADSCILRCSRRWFMDTGFKRPFYIVESLTDEIRQAERSLFNKIIRTIGHEVNNTLGSVISVLDSVAKVNEGNPVVAEAINGCTLSSRQLVKFVKGYADVVKLPAPVPAKTDALEWLDSITPTLQSIAGQSAQLTTYCKPGTILNIDTTLMERVLINVVKNAAESIGSTPGGRIDVTIEPGTIAVTDNGPGIAPEVAYNLFTPFFSTKRPDRGLGLMLVSDILHAHGATCSLATDPATGLTTFQASFS